MMHIIDSKVNRLLLSHFRDKLTLKESYLWRKRLFVGKGAVVSGGLYKNEGG